MAKFGKVAAIVSMDNANNQDEGFQMSNYYGNRLRSANDNVEEIQEVQETLYGDEGSQIMSNYQSESAIDHNAQQIIQK